MSPSTEYNKAQEPTLLLIAPLFSYRITPYLQAARQFNLKVVIASQGENSLVSSIAQGIHINLSNLEQAFEQLTIACAEHDIRGVVATDDYTVELAARLARHLRLPHNPPQATRLTRWKHLARQQLKSAGLTVPWHQLIPLQGEFTQQDIPYPCVIKPLNLSGSRGVIRVDNEQQLQLARQSLRDIVSDQTEQQAREFALLEQYIEGKEVAVEAILQNSRLIPLAIFDKPEPLQGPYFEESYYITPSTHSQVQQQALLETVAAACQAYGLQTGPVHAELRFNDEGCWVIEIAARTIGGECARLLELSTGFSVEALVISHAIGKPLPVEHGQQSAGVLMIPIPKSGILRRVEGLLAAQKIPLIEDVKISVANGHEVQTLPEGSSYLGFIYASGDTPREVHQALRQAHQQLNFVITPLWKLTPA